MKGNAQRTSNEPVFAPGFRFSAFDAVILVVGTAAAGAAAWWVEVWLGIAIIFVVLHFFLFCNVVRMSPRLEFVWAICFAALVTAFDFVGWPIALAGTSIVTLICVGIQLSLRSYHGVGWSWINPKLPEWWRKRYA